MGTIHNLRDTPLDTPVQKENPVTSNSRSIKERFIDLLEGYTESQQKYIDSFFVQVPSLNKGTEDFLNTCSHKEFYEFIEGSPGLQKVFLIKFKERVKYPALKKDTNYTGEFQIKKAPGAGATTDRFKITREDMIYYMTQMKLFKIKE